jgi:hypothetical protein
VIEPLVTLRSFATWSKNGMERKKGVVILAKFFAIREGVTIFVT